VGVALSGEKGGKKKEGKEKERNKLKQRLLMLRDLTSQLLR